MIMGHIGFGPIFDKWIHVFHMPMFFVVSGYFYNGNNGFKEYLIKNVRKLLVPYVLFGLFHCIIKSVIIKHFDLIFLYQVFWDNTKGSGIPIAGALWFLTSLFLAVIIFWVVHHIRCDERYKSIIVIVISVLGMSLVSLPVRLPFAVDTGLVGVGFCQVGYLLKEKWKRLIDLSLLISIIILVVSSTLGMINGDVNLKDGIYSNWVLFWLSSIGTTVSFWNIYRFVYGHIPMNIRSSCIMTWLRGIGKYSIIYLCLNQFCILIANFIISNYFKIIGLSIQRTNYLVLIITLLLLFIFEQIIIKSKLRFVIGK